MDAHLSEEHAILRCESCMAFVHRETPGMHAHRMDECPLRNVECRFCKACVTHSDLKMHYRVKLEALHAYLTTVHLQVDQLEKTKQQYLEYIGAVQAELKNCGE